jgi:hypothetical protein
MNELSWMLYFAEIAETVGTFFGVFGILGGLTCITLAILFYGAASDTYGEEKEKYLSTSRLFSRKLLPLAAFFVLLSCFIPSKQTIYLIIASETGEDVLKSPTGQKAIEAVNRYLDKVGREEKEKEDAEQEARSR